MQHFRTVLGDIPQSELGIGFHTGAPIREDNPYEHIFSRLIPAMLKVGFNEGEIHKMLTQNVGNMLLCK